ncbi:MAG TPA: ChbG/HpnK family deacetylase [Thermomicrobiales bacterium]|nr:ChbG/HpnK family deacetylase [Thermomicrobiales bacterium]
MSPWLIVNADDFGRSPGINRGIVEAHQRGIVSSTTLMVNLPASTAAAALAIITPDLGIGLHLNYCYGPPLASGVDSLLGPDGLLDRDLHRLRQRATVDDLTREARAQLHLFRELLGRDPTHLDSHQHVHSWPVAIGPVVALARELGVPIRACTAEHRATLRMFGVRCPDTFIIDFYGTDKIDTGTLAERLSTLPPGVTELMCHPGYVDAEIADSSYRTEREEELATLCSPAIGRLVSELQIELVTFASLG